MRLVLFKYCILTVILILVLDITFRCIAKKLGHKRLLKLSGFFHALCTILLIYFIVFTFSSIRRIEPLAGRTITVYEFPDEEKVNSVTNATTRKYIKNNSQLQEDNYYDKVCLTFKSKNLSYLEYLGNTLSYPFYYRESQYFEIAAKEIKATRVEMISGIPSLDEYSNVVTLNNYTFRYNGEFQQGMFEKEVVLKVCYEAPDSETGVIENYVFLEGEY